MQLTGFYPDIVFFYDDLDMTPNLYSFDAYGQRMVVVSGGLARMQGFNYEGLFMAMAHGIGCFVGGEPKNAQGFSGVGQADLFAFGVISRQCWFGAPLPELRHGGDGAVEGAVRLGQPRARQGQPPTTSSTTPGCRAGSGRSRRPRRAAPCPNARAAPPSPKCRCRRPRRPARPV